MPVTFNTYKTSIVNKLHNRRLINMADAREIMQSRTKYGLADRVSCCFDEKVNDNSQKAMEIAKRGFVLDSEVTLIRTMQTKIEDMAVMFAKILSKKDTNPEVIKIKKEIRSKFGIKSLYLDNNLNYAKRILKSLEILRNNNIPLADEIIVNSMLNMSAGISNPKKKVMLINPNAEDRLITSTDSPLHDIIHEGIHIGQPDNPAIQFQKMPDKYKGTIDALSMYASDNFILEVHAELMTKKILRPKLFTDEEQAALDYIENLFKQHA